MLFRSTFDRMIRVPSMGLYSEIKSEPHKYHLMLIEAMLKRDRQAAYQLIRHECSRDDDTEDDF